MSNSTNTRHHGPTVRRKLLTSVSATTLFVSAYTVGEALAANAASDRPPVWIEIGGDYFQLDDSWQKFNPPFASNIPGDLPSPMSVERSPVSAFDWEGKLSIQPEDSDWVLKAAVRFGHAGGDSKVLKSLTSTSPKQFVDYQASASERHTILDFTVGRDVGVGLFGGTGTGTLSGGVRMAQFISRAAADLNHTFVYAKYDNVFDATTQEHRNFHGVGPEITWEASQPILENTDLGKVAIDWGLNAAVLFGRQRATLQQTVNYIHRHYVQYSSVKPAGRVRNVTVPNVGAYVGLSMNYRNAKISAGYRTDFFFGAMDGGIDTAKSYDRGFFGPYASVSIGLGG